MVVSIASREDPDQTALIWVCTVCLGLFGVRNFKMFTVYILLKL